ncbi:uncharacterized protein [Symphalangus syndactylus]|uniref:uncharacterized protein isoform X3 n=1 Tax=Symphalangus syndactylus TaxID=9590 RepID=UPI00300430F6
MARDTNKGTRFHSADSNHSGSNSTSPPSVSKVTTQHVVGSFAQARRAFKPSPTRRGPALSLSLPVIWRERPVRAGAVGGPGRAVPGVTLRRADYIIKSTKLKHLQGVHHFTIIGSGSMVSSALNSFFPIMKRKVKDYIGGENKHKREIFQKKKFLQGQDMLQDAFWLHLLCKIYEK